MVNYRSNNFITTAGTIVIRSVAVIAHHLWEISAVRKLINNLLNQGSRRAFREYPQIQSDIDLSYPRQSIHSLLK
jgi:hypothetical protein